MGCYKIKVEIKYFLKKRKEEGRIRMSNGDSGVIATVHHFWFAGGLCFFNQSVNRILHKREEIVCCRKGPA